MANKQGRGLANADEETKKMVSDLGNEAQGHQVSGSEPMLDDTEEGFDQTNMDIKGQEGESARGLGKLKQEGRDEEVEEIASMGGSASHGGGRSSQDEDEE